MKIFKLWENQGKKIIPQLGCIITPDGVEKDVVLAGWSYAVHHTPKTLSTPDYGAALKLLLERHPSWQFIAGDVDDIFYKTEFIDQDKPDHK